MPFPSKIPQHQDKAESSVLTPQEIALQSTPFNGNHLEFMQHVKVNTEEIRNNSILKKFIKSSETPKSIDIPKDNAFQNGYFVN